MKNKRCKTNLKPQRNKRLVETSSKRTLSYILDMYSTYKSVSLIQELSNRLILKRRIRLEKVILKGLF